MTDHASPTPPPFTVEDTREMFRGVLRRDKMPTMAACAKVGSSLHGLRRRHDALKIILPQIAAETDTRYAIVRVGLAAVRDLCGRYQSARPKIEAALEAMKAIEAQHDRPSWWPVHEMVVGWRVLAHTAEHLDNLADQPPSYEWTDLDFVAELLWIFGQAMKSTNPDVEYKVSADGPATRFIQRGLNLCCDRNMTLAAIRQMYDRAMKTADANAE